MNPSILTLRYISKLVKHWERLVKEPVVRIVPRCVNGRSIKPLLRTVVLIVGCLVFASQTTADTQQPSPSASTPSVNGDLKPPFTMNAIKRGKRLYASHCVLCHGADGRGDTQMREFLKTYPANLVDGQWRYGAKDSDIVDVIKNGRPAQDMPAFGQQLSDERVWQVVHYIRYLGGKPLVAE